ncbi:MAG TPA: lectin [Rhodanobacteraceae bacterium]|nr:lectin [Rhodanobacteraceae bacterium]
MKWIALFALLCLPALSGCGESMSPPAAPPTAADGALVLARYDGYGDMRFGMDEAAFRAAWQGELKGQSGDACFYLWPKWVKAPSDFAFMFEHGKFVRYDVGTAKEAAPGGGKVGMTGQQIRDLYAGHVAVQPHKYVAGGQVLRVTRAAGEGVLVFEVGADGKVTAWRAGVPPQVDYVEGCS